MALVKETVVDKIESLENGVINVRTATIVKEGTSSSGYTELSRSYHRHVLEPRIKNDSDWSDPDISGEDSKVQAIANATWTTDVKNAYEAWNYGK